MCWLLKINASTPSQNQWDRCGWRTKHNLLRQWWLLVRGSCDFLTVPKATGKRRLTIERHARGIQQDPSNTIGGAKAIIDVLVKHGLLVDDSPAWIEHGKPLHVPLKPKEKPYTVLIIEDVDAA